ncbi:DUF2268 domain-containing protein [Oceanobacillus halophilus]|uniref:Zn-dependent protease n=1 Tax=Oceanobacillus halophilus TaxID=930130 RepID=A0A495AAY4_9BACI|nr:DUF2268 domain-containing protein [Oceanobacillus halophilus]RKQ37251.1 Zn-dependent protease [Oceanobacillus halophilus]
MSVIRTDKWLKQEMYLDPLKLCTKLERYFQDVTEYDIFQHLSRNGMYRHRLKNGDEFIENLSKTNIYKIVKQEHLYLMNKWNGPDIPIFILPSDYTNRKLINEFNGKSGLAFHDKLFLFISDDNSINEIKALFTHEYNHVCRLLHYPKKERKYTLLDTIILEGLAENAVRERFGKSYLASWTAYYSSDNLRKFWEKIISPNKHLIITNRKHNELLYGLRFYPRMLGYAVGYYLVVNYVEENKISMEELLCIPSERIPPQ